MWWIVVVCFSNRHANLYFFMKKYLSIRIYWILLVFEFPCHFFLPKGFWRLTNIVLSLTKIVILFSVFHPTRIFEIKSDKIILYIVLWPSQRSLRALPAQWNLCCTYFIGAVNYNAVVYCIGRRRENFIGNWNDLICTIGHR